MVVGADVQHRCISKSGGIQKIGEIVEIPVPSSPFFHQICANGSVSVSSGVSLTELDLIPPKSAADVSLEDQILDFPCIRSGSFSDIGPRRYMEDEHIRIDDLSAHFGSIFRFPLPSAFYGVFDGHGGADVAAYLKKNALRCFFEDADFPQSNLADDAFVEGVENSVRNAFLSADLALADDCSISSSSGSAVITALIFGRLLLVANSGDCRAVLCRKGEAVDMSRDHRPTSASEQRRIEDSGGFVDDGYLNGLLSVSRALGDWDMKLPKGSVSPLIAEPELRQVILTEDDEFLIIACDGIWDVISSQDAVALVQRGLRRHDDPERCAKELVREALRKNTFDNLTVIIVCFSSDLGFCQNDKPRLRCCSISAEALCSLQRLLE